VTLALIFGGLVSLLLIYAGWAGLSIGGDPRSRIKRQAPWILGAGAVGVAASVVGLMWRLL
jgi:hypothetical protein